LETSNKNRNLAIDALRGLAIVMMISFHFCYDLQYFKIYNFHITTNSFFLNYRLIIVNLFLFIAGVSLTLANQNGINWQKVKKRASVLGASSLIISVVTYFIFPRTWIYFGVIHFIFVASLLALVFLNRPKTALLSAFVIMFFYFNGTINMHSVFNYLQPILHLPKHHTEDLVPLIPWLSSVLFGVAFGGFGLHKYLKIKPNLITNKLALIGKHSLLIYLIHQPILFGLFYIFTQFVGL